MCFGGVLIMANAQSFTLHKRVAFPAGREENMVQAHVMYSKGRGFVATIQPATEKDGCVSVILDLSGQFRFPLAQAPRFNARTLAEYRVRFGRCLPHLAEKLAAHGPESIREDMKNIAII